MAKPKAAKAVELKPEDLSEKDVLRLVDQAVQKDRYIRELEKELKTIEATLVAVATLRKKTDGSATESGGWSVDLPGLEGDVCKVTQAGPGVKTLSAEDFAELRNQFPEIPRLFERVVKWAPIESFDTEIKTWVPDAVERRKLVTNVQKKGTLRVGYQTKESAAKAE